MTMATLENYINFLATAANDNPKCYYLELLEYLRDDDTNLVNIGCDGEIDVELFKDFNIVKLYENEAIFVYTTDVENCKKFNQDTGHSVAWTNYKKGMQLRIDCIKSANQFLQYFVELYGGEIVESSEYGICVVGATPPYDRKKISTQNFKVDYHKIDNVIHFRWFVVNGCEIDQKQFTRRFYANWFLYVNTDWKCLEKFNEVDKKFRFCDYTDGGKRYTKFDNNW
jgi:hypothetical protein